jgi:PAS domain S-box-containing protein
MRSWGLHGQIDKPLSTLAWIILMPPTNKASLVYAMDPPRAEGLNRGDTAGVAEGMDDLSPSDTHKLIHELRRTQAELDTAHARYVDLYDLAPVGYVTVNDQGLVLLANLTTAALLGVTRSQLVGQAFSRFIRQEDEGTYCRLRQRLSETGSAQSCELQMDKQGGNPLFVHLDAVAVRGDDGVPVLRLVLTDITEKNAAATAAIAAATVANDQFLRTILDSVNAEIVVLDHHGVIRTVNEPWQRFAQNNSITPGIPTAHTGVGVNYLAACLAHIDDPHHATATAAHDGIQAVLAGEIPSFSLEYPCHSPERQQWFYMRALPLGNDAEDGLTITHTDITAFRQAEESLRIAAVAFETQDAIAVLDNQRQILRVNQAFTGISGYTEQELLGKSISILCSMRHSASFYENIWRETNNEGRERGGRWVQHKNGSDLFAQCTTTTVRDQRGRITHYVITFSDQTLTHQQDQQRVRHEVEHRDALVREVHHRIKNNLQGIGGLLQQFASQKPEIAEQMRLVAGHLNGISVIHGLQGRHDKFRVRLCELTREIAQATSAIWQTDIVIDIPPQWCWRIVAESDAVSMALVLNELLVNAVKHGGKAKAHVSVTLRQGPGIEGVDLIILNAGHLRNNKDRPTTHHHGLQLIESLRPRQGVTMTQTQVGDQVLTLLQVTAPVISLDTET